MTRLEIPVPLRWSDLDAYGHVNNVEVLRLLEEARIAAFWRAPGDADHAGGHGVAPTAVIDAGPGASTHTLVARQEVEYLLPIAYQREPLVVEMWLGHLGGASIEVCYQVTSRISSERVVLAQAATTLVLIDAATSRPRRITADERAAWEVYLEEPVALRRRAQR